MSNTLKTVYDKIKNPLRIAGIGTMGAVALTGCAETPAPDTSPADVYVDYIDESSRYENNAYNPETNEYTVNEDVMESGVVEDNQNQDENGVSIENEVPARVEPELSVGLAGDTESTEGVAAVQLTREWMINNNMVSGALQRSSTQTRAGVITYRAAGFREGELAGGGSALIFTVAPNGVTEVLYDGAQ